MKKIRKSFDFSSFLCSIKRTLLSGKWGLMVLLLLELPLVALAQDQKVTINVKEVDVQVVFKQIKEQTGLNFVYNADQLKTMKRVTLDVKEVTVDAALTKLFEGTSFEYKFEMQSIVIKKKVERFANKKVMVNGQVVDKAGNALPGVAVLMKGTTVGTATDVDGKFKFLAPREEDLVLVFSFIGMKRLEIPAKFGEPMKVTLEEDATELEEVNVISTGYYNVDKRHLTSSVTSLKMDDIMIPGVSTIDQMLEGNVPGMIFMQNSGQVGAAPKLKIRGSTTVLGSQAPLWVLDGVILTDPVNVDPQQINDLDFVNLLGNAISGLNPDDIERIDVLKDASATAIY
ncbi:MAG TPA: carboxypeptidase-like regulatory domain-containing protein, partial [Candidatus Butyricimonas faecavium]|nr:carboxypeptidase-like regulatory domain-containing protein [Candidatus Butyricimonas faecavium]